MTAAIIAALALIIAGIALVIAVKASDETQKLAGELHRAPADINVYETRVTPAIAYSSVEGGKAPDWMAAATKRQLKRNAMRYYTHRGWPCTTQCYSPTSNAKNTPRQPT